MKNPFQGDDHPPEGDRDSEDVPWLRDMVDDEYQALFVEDERKLKHAVRHFIRAVQDDSDVEQKLIDLLETAVEKGNDDSSASLLTAIILGEARSLRAVTVLARCLAWEEDETLQDAAQVALLRIGPAAVRQVMEALEESDSAAFSRSAYGLLGQVGVLEDEELNEAVREFLRDRVALERKKQRDESSIGELFLASALLGDRKQLGPLKQVLADDFRGKNPSLQDACEMLEENADGVPFVPTPAPWEARYGWLHEDARDQARVTRSRSGEVSLTLFDGDDPADDDPLDEAPAEEDQEDPGDLLEEEPADDFEDEAPGAGDE